MFDLIPFRRGNQLSSSRDIRDFFDDFFSDVFVPAFFPEHPMRADIRETDKEYIIEVEMPGVRKEDIKVELNNDVITISAERKEEVNEEKENYIRRERKFGSYSRSFRVGDIKNENVKAKYEDGILKIVLPKANAEQSRRKQINID